MRERMSTIEKVQTEKRLVAAKWVPVINDYCVGCGKCVDRCPHGCLASVFDTANLRHADRCVSGGDCVTVCEDNAIHMQWLPMRGNHDVGQWQEGDDPPEEPGKNGSGGVAGLLKRLFGRK